MRHCSNEIKNLGSGVGLKLKSWLCYMKLGDFNKLLNFSDPPFSYLYNKGSMVVRLK